MTTESGRSSGNDELKPFWAALADRLDVPKIAPILVSKDVLAPNWRDTEEKLSTKQEEREAILKIVRGQGPSGIQKFKDALEEIGQSHLMTPVEPSLRENPAPSASEAAESKPLLLDKGPSIETDQTGTHPHNVNKPTVAYSANSKRNMYLTSFGFVCLIFLGLFIVILLVGSPMVWSYMWNPTKVNCDIKESQQQKVILKPGKKNAIDPFPMDWDGVISQLHTQENGPTTETSESAEEKGNFDTAPEGNSDWVLNVANALDSVEEIAQLLPSMTEREAAAWNNRREAEKEAAREAGAAGYWRKEVENGKADVDLQRALSYESVAAAWRAVAVKWEAARVAYEYILEKAEVENGGEDLLYGLESGIRKAKLCWNEAEEANIDAEKKAKAVSLQTSKHIF
ncbi:unnamed protein product [Darwinula stevensoni]|uniref:CARD domain-containing protein n=1 Tax=Darwinula stevensoni TaxID=69355 RepID=A0A7R9ADC5_9CRUS|nr:unnamed protein product [Darwinula stevensoni]CAG0900958.1 unnamed protein product [Darwinula stevensoni]